MRKLTFCLSFCFWKVSKFWYPDPELAWCRSFSDSETSSSLESNKDFFLLNNGELSKVLYNKKRKDLISGKSTAERKFLYFDWDSAWLMSDANFYLTGLNDWWRRDLRLRAISGVFGLLWEICGGSGTESLARISGWINNTKLGYIRSAKLTTEKFASLKWQRASSVHLTDSDIDNWQALLLQISS